MRKNGRVFGAVAIAAGIMICAVPAFAGLAGRATQPAVKLSNKQIETIYAIIRDLGPGGGPVPPYLPPDREPKPPYAQFYLLPQ